MSGAVVPPNNTQNPPTQPPNAELPPPTADIDHHASIGASSTIVNNNNSPDPDPDPYHPSHPNNDPVISPRGPTKADTDLSWGLPAGLPIRRLNDENLIIFRRAVGINSTLSGSADPDSLEAGRRKAVGIYAEALGEVRRKRWMSQLLSVCINASHFAQIVIGASLTALGPTAGNYVIVITFLGAINTVLAGAMALIKGQGLPDRLYHERAEFRRLQDWIEQTEALLAVGVIGRNRKEVGVLVQSAFRKYNAAKQCEENNVPENYLRQPDPDETGMPAPHGSPSPPNSHFVQTPRMHH